MTWNRSGSVLWLRPALFALSVGLTVAGCSEQKLNGFGSDISPPIVSITKTKGDTMDVADGLQIGVAAADNLGLKSVSISFTGGYTAQIDSTFHTAISSITIPVNIQFPKGSSAGGRVFIKATATDGNNNSATAQDSVVLTNKDALIVTLLRPTTGAVTSGGKQVLIQINAHQNKGITKIGWIAAGAGVTGTDSIIYGPPLDTSSAGPTFTDTLTVPASATTGVFTVTGFAEDALNRRVTTVATPVTLQSVASDNTPPVVTFTVAKRVEVRDSISVRATDPSGIAKLGWIAVSRATGGVLGGDSITASGALTDVIQNFNLNFNFATFPQDVLISAFAVDAANNRGQATVGISASSPVRTDTVTVVNGITKPLPRGGRVADAIYNKNLNEIYLTNVDRNWLEIFSVTDTSFKSAPICPAPNYCGVPVGSRPWGLALWPRDTLGNNGDTVVVANSGGTDLSVVDLQVRRERRRHLLPNFLLQTVHTELSSTNQIVLKIVEYDFTDRPEYLALTCRPAGGTACPGNAIYAVYSTTPTKSQSSDFKDRATMRWENMNPATHDSHFFWEHAEVSPSPDADSIQILADHGPGTPTDTVLSVACGVMVMRKELAFLDTTFVRNSGNFTHALIGEGGTGDPVLGFARAIGYSTTPGLTIGTCTGTLIGSGSTTITFTGPGERDNGISPGIRVRDYLSNTAAGVHSIATNFNGLTNLIRADSVYVLNESLRLMGLLAVPGDNPGMDLNFNHAFDASIAGTPTFGGSMSPNDRLVFVARPDANIDAMDTFFYGTVASIPIRDPVIGPLRVAKLPSGEQILVGVTAKGVVTVRLPAITNIYQTRQWGAARVP